MAYFKYFPSINYNLWNDNEKLKFNSIKNVLIRARKKLEITNAAIFEQTFIQDGDRADTLAYQFYGDSTLHWIIMYANYMTDPYYDWPLTYFDLQKFIAKKYGPISEGGNGEGINGIHHYEDSDGNTVEAPGTIISSGGTTAGPANAISNVIYEERKNDQKRTIDIIRPEYVDQIIKEFKQIIE